MKTFVLPTVVISTLLLSACSAAGLDPSEEASKPAEGDVTAIGQDLDPGRIGYAQHPSGVALIKVYPTNTFEKGDGIAIGKSDLVMQWDGNLVLYDERGRQPQFARWSSGTYPGSEPGPGDHATMQMDGNFVVYNEGGDAVGKRSDTWGHPGLFLAVQSDGNVVIYDSSWHVYWSTGTNH
jgi:hypothetical protein